MVAPKTLVAFFALALVVFTVGAASAQMDQMQMDQTQTQTMQSTTVTTQPGMQETITVTDLPRLFEPKTATITITNSGIDLSPDVPGPGPVEFTVINQSNSPRGIVMNGFDRANTPIIRYSPRIAPGESRRVSFWIYPDQNFTVRDYTSRRVVNGESVWSSSFRTAFAGPAAPTTTIALAPPTTTIPGGVGAGAGVGAGPMVPSNVNVLIQNQTLTLNPVNVPPGPVNFTITNTTNVPRAFAVDVNGQLYQTRLLAPGESDTLSLNLPAGNYRFYTIVGGQMTLNQDLIVR